jgi:hypothetical protein
MTHIVSAFRLVEAQNNGASIRKPLAIEYKQILLVKATSFYQLAISHRPTT